MKFNEKRSASRYVEEDESYWQEHLTAFMASDLTRTSYCKEFGINYHRFGYWKNRLLDKSITSSERITKPSKLVPITLKAENGVSDKSKSLCSLHLKNGSVLQIHDERALSLLLAKVV